MTALLFLDSSITIQLAEQKVQQTAFWVSLKCQVYFVCGKKEQKKKKKKKKKEKKKEKKKLEKKSHICLLSADIAKIISKTF